MTALYISLLLIVACLSKGISGGTRTELHKSLKEGLTSRSGQEGLTSRSGESYFIVAKDTRKKTSQNKHEQQKIKKTSKRYKVKSKQQMKNEIQHKHKQAQTKKKLKQEKHKKDQRKLGERKCKKNKTKKKLKQQKYKKFKPKNISGQKRRQKPQNKKKSGQEKQATCDGIAIIDKLNYYIKVSNFLEKVKRIAKVCNLMDNKANKTVTEFEATIAALENATKVECGTNNLTLSNTGIRDKLKNCRATAKTNCEKSSVAACRNVTHLAFCEGNLQGWIDTFGKCRNKKDSCDCFTGLEKNVSKDCFDGDYFNSTKAIERKDNCTKNDVIGSFGYCRKLQQQAAERDTCVCIKDNSLMRSYMQTARMNSNPDEPVLKMKTLPKIQEEDVVSAHKPYSTASTSVRKKDMVSKSFV